MGLQFSNFQEAEEVPPDYMEWFLDNVYPSFTDLSLEELFEIDPEPYLMLHGTTTRRIDTLIHLLGSPIVEDHKVTRAEHEFHEYMIMQILDKFDDLPEFFNEDVDYPARYYLRGHTGTMSSILLNSQFRLYLFLLQKGVNVNVYSDSLLLLFKIINNELSEADRENIITILSYLKSMETVPIFTPQWWKEFIIVYTYDYLWCDSNRWCIPTFNNILIQKGGFLKDYISRDPANVRKLKDVNLFFDWEYAPLAKEEEEGFGKGDLQKVRDMFLI